VSSSTLDVVVEFGSGRTVDEVVTSSVGGLVDMAVVVAHKKIHKIYLVLRTIRTLSCKVSI
jgi:hypothetical protein